VNIAFFTNNYRPFVGGVPIAIDNLAGALKRRGHKVHIYAPDYGNDVDETGVFRTLSIQNFNDSQFALPIPLALDTYLTFNDTNAEIVHVHHPFLLGISGLNAARSEKLPCVFTYHTQYERYAHYLPWDQEMVTEMAVNIATRFANSCDAVIAPSTDMEKTLRERGVDVPIRVIPTGVDLQRFRGGDRATMRERLGIPEAARVLLFVSRLAKEKNVALLIEAFAKLQEQRGDTHLLVVGDGDEKGSLKEQAQQLGLQDLVHFTGTLSGEELISAYKGSDLFVFASTSETQGMVVLEAMAAGLPVVAVDAPGVRDVVENGVNGFMVRDSDAESFARACLEILGDPHHAEKFRYAALEKAQQLSLDSTTARVEELYNFVSGNQHPERTERFLIVKELIRYHVQKFTESLATALTV